MKRIKATVVPLIVLAVMFARPLSCGAEVTTAQADQSANALNNEGLAFMQQSRMADAESRFRAAAELSPKEALYRSNQGYALLKLGKTAEALKCLQTAVQLKPDLDMAWLNLGLAYEDCGQPREAVSALQKYVGLAEPSAQRTRIQAHIDLLKKEGLGNAGSDSGTNYVSTLGKTARLRWSNKAMPVKVLLKYDQTDHNFRPEYVSILTDAFDQWTQATDGKLTYKIVDRQPSDIVVEWTSDPSNVINIAEGGDTRFEGNSEGLKSARIKLLTCDPPSRKLTPELMRWVSLHEVGHALGLLAHSHQPADIMYESAPQADKDFRLSDRDKDTIKQYYTANLGPNWLQLNDEGIALASKGNYEQALFKYKEAMAQNPDSNIPHKNAIRAEYSWAISLLKSGHVQEAEPHLASALAMEDKARDENLTVLLETYGRFLRMQNRTAEAEQMEKKYK